MLLDFLANPTVLVASIALLGLLVGSFLNDVILRLPQRLQHDWQTQSRELLGLPVEDLLHPPGIVRESSHCPKCKHRLSPYENIPVFSWLYLRGRCRHCHESISIQYPLVEFLTAVTSALIAWKFGLSVQMAAGLILTWVLIAAAGIDARTQLLPDNLTLPLLWLGLLLSLYGVFIDSHASILGAAIGYLSLWSVYWLFKLLTGKEGMGYGDFKLLAALGAWMGTGSILPIVLLSAVAGAIIGIIILKLQDQDRSAPIPFGPFIAVAGWAYFVYGEQIWNFYRNTFLISGT